MINIQGSGIVDTGHGYLFVFDDGEFRHFADIQELFEFMLSYYEGRGRKHSGDNFGYVHIFTESGQIFQAFSEPD